jgi:hypothetical protein
MVDVFQEVLLEAVLQVILGIQDQDHVLEEQEQEKEFALEGKDILEETADV